MGAVPRVLGARRKLGLVALEHVPGDRPRRRSAVPVPATPQLLLPLTSVRKQDASILHLRTYDVCIHR